MQGFPRLIVLAAVFGLMLWYALGRSPDDQGGYQATPDDSSVHSSDSTEREPWSQEDRAMWRDTVDQRLRR